MGLKPKWFTCWVCDSILMPQDLAGTPGMCLECYEAATYKEEEDVYEYTK